MEQELTLISIFWKFKEIYWPVCCLTWLTKCSFLVKDFAQNRHRCGDSPVCCLTWFSRCSFLVNVFEQKSHRWGVSPVCHIMWFVKCSFLVKDFPHISHLKKNQQSVFEIFSCDKLKLRDQILTLKKENIEIGYLKGVSFVWLLMWFARCSFLVYFFPQMVQWWGVSPVCHITWFMKCSFLVKDFLQISHLWGVSPVCFLTWFTICSFLVNVFAQYWHLYGVSPVWHLENKNSQKNMKEKTPKRQFNNCRILQYCQNVFNIINIHNNQIYMYNIYK